MEDNLKYTAPWSDLGISTTNALDTYEFPESPRP